MERNPLPRYATSASLPGEASAQHPVVAFAVSLRPDQWIKNLIVFAGLIFGQRLQEPTLIVTSFVAFAVFCALSSAMYLVNDVIDQAEDQRHPTKSRRPIAAGTVSPRTAVIGSVGLASTALGVAFWLSHPFGLVALTFVGVVALYSQLLKHVVILDVFTIAAGFVLRAVAGAVAVAVPISQWLLVCTMLLALFLGLAKRRHELILLGDEAPGHRRALAEYTPRLLDQLISIVAAATVVSYAFYTVEPATVEKFGTDLLTLTVPFPVYGVFRYLYLVHRQDGGGSPAEMLLRDRPLLACVMLWAAAIVLIIYRPFAG